MQTWMCACCMCERLRMHHLWPDHTNWLYIQYENILISPLRLTTCINKCPSFQTIVCIEVATPTFTWGADYTSNSSMNSVCQSPFHRPLTTPAGIIQIEHKMSILFEGCKRKQEKLFKNYPLNVAFSIVCWWRGKCTFVVFAVEHQRLCMCSILIIIIIIYVYCTQRTHGTLSVNAFWIFSSQRNEHKRIMYILYITIIFR